MQTISLTGNTSVQYEIEALIRRYGTQEWDRTGHGFFDNLDEARAVAEELNCETRIARIEITRTVI